MSASSSGGVPMAVVRTIESLSCKNSFLHFPRALARIAVVGNTFAVDGVVWLRAAAFDSVAHDDVVALVADSLPLKIEEAAIPLI